MVSEINAKLDLRNNLKTNKTMENLQETENFEPTLEDAQGRTFLFNSPEEYNTLTGKRFRHRKVEKAQGLTRLEAFNLRKVELHFPFLTEDGTAYSLNYPESGTSE